MGGRNGGGGTRPLSHLTPAQLLAILDSSRGQVPAITERLQRRAIDGGLLPRAIGPETGDGRHSAVLVLLYPRHGELTLALTERAGRLRQHSGQISLPGGRKEPSDESLWHTAVRETHEELGVLIDVSAPSAVLERIYVPVSNFYVTAYVACLDERPPFVPNQNEVAELIEVSVEELRKTESFVVDERDYQEQRVVEGFFRVGAHRIWGATALLIDQLLQRLEVGLSTAY